MRLRLLDVTIVLGSALLNVFMTIDVLIRMLGGSRASRARTMGMILRTTSVDVGGLGMLERCVGG